MADVRNIQKGGGDLSRGGSNQIGPNEPSAKSGGENAQRVSTGSAEIKEGQKVLSDAVTGKEATQLKAGQRLSSLGGGSATERLLGLDLRPTMPGTLTAPPGNSDFLRHLSPTMRRTIMRNMLARQRERMKRLAAVLKDQREHAGEEERDDAESAESFLQSVSETFSSEESELARAIGEMGRSARMLDILDELLAMQDFTISQMGTFSKG